MKCIVEVISDTLSKPNPLPISEECLETLRGGTAAGFRLGIWQIWRVGAAPAPTNWALASGPLSRVPDTFTFLFHWAVLGPRRRDGAAACPKPCLVLALWPRGAGWHQTAWASQDLPVISITWLRDVRANQVKGKKRVNEEGGAFGVLFNFLGLGGGLLWLLSILSLPCCRWTNYFYPSPPKLVEGTSGNCCSRYSATIFSGECNYREDCFLLL